MKTITLKFDLLTKVILTVIASALLGILLKDLFKPSPAEAYYDQVVKLDYGSIIDLANQLDGLNVKVTNTVDVCETCQ